KKHIRELYAYESGTVLFKPTLASLEQFRQTPDAALSYFSASNGACAEDQGFAIKGWTKVRFENSGVILDTKNALAMGNYFFTGPDGSETKVEYTFGYILGDDGRLRIQLHHSSMPAGT
ncbi:MAG: phosphoribosyl-AMP cyclohydrolase, partial [Euryarchaeota archaeon]|nr:phosphoribosyl-AMP cyclohydrolase [Euryarchaeota archaeon]NDB94409.1 phosphoribosyl-AMP cyclohydrolase [Euryarchaeota archaeon]